MTDNNKIQANSIGNNTIQANLTEKLKKGELPDNHHYYYRLPKGTYEVGNTFCLETLRYCKDGDKIEVIAEVPSYEELQNQAFILKSRESEITKLKKLLKECRKHFINYKRDDLDKGYVVYDGSYLIDKINQVLGEE